MMAQGRREIAFDTETTGLEALNGDRIIELGCVEMIDGVQTGRVFQRYINPERSVSEKTIEITGITDDILVDKPVFSHPDVVEAFLDFVGDAPLVAHNASFDKGFINAELARAGWPVLEDVRFVDTLVLAREKFPGASNSLDALCKRFGVSLERRDKHGALLDATLLAEVYLELLGGREQRLDLSMGMSQTLSGDSQARRALRPRPVPLPERLLADELAAHQAFLEGLEAAGVALVWRRER